MAAKRKPRRKPRTLSNSEYARHRKTHGYTGGSHQAVANALKEGRIHLQKDGRIDPRRADREWAQNTRPAGAGRGGARENAGRFSTVTGPSPGPKDEDPDLFAANDLDVERLTVAQADLLKVAYDAGLKRLNYLARRGELVDARKVAARNFQVARTIREKIMAIAARISYELAAETDPAKIEDKLTAEFRQVLTALADAPAGDEQLEDMQPPQDPRALEKDSDATG